MLNVKIKENISLMYGDIKYIKSIKIKKELMKIYLEKSCKFGHLEIVKYLLDLFNENDYLLKEKLFRISCEYGHLKISKYLLAKYPNISVEDSGAIFYALQNDYIKTAQWLFHPYNREYIKKCIRIIVKTNNINFLKWIMNNDPLFEYINDIFIICIKNKNIFNYILSLEKCSQKSLKLQYALDYFCKNGSLEEIKYLFSVYDKYNIYNCLINSETHNNIKIFNYLLDNFTEHLDKDLLFKLLIINYNEKYLNIFIEKYINCLNTNDLFYYVCIYGILSIMKDFYSESISNLDKCMQTLLDNNHLECIEWLSVLIKDKIDFKKLKFDYVRDNQIILFLNDYNINIPDELFNKALKFGYIDLIMTLCKLYPIRFKYDKSKKSGFIIKRSKLIKEKMCHICLYEFKNNVVLNCGHLFCDDCINEWLKIKHTCPICRENIVNIISIT